MPAPTHCVEETDLFVSVEINLPSHYLRLDDNGRIIFDECPTDLDHFAHPLSTDEVRSICRHSLTNFIPAHMMQRKGRWKVTFTLEPE